MNPDFSKTHFALFGLSPSFHIDVAGLDAAYRKVQKEVHPDRFANAPDVVKRLAAQWATQANEAYRTLKSPLNRGRYLLKINGIDTEEERNTSMPLEFLKQQIAWREAVVEAKAAHDEAALATLAKQKHVEEKSLLELLATQLADTVTMMDAKQTVRKLRFLEKLGEEIDLATELLD